MRIMESFEDFNLSPDVFRALGYMGFKQPTDIQKRALPIVFQRADVIAQAKTGTGKTAVFGIYLVETLERRNSHPQALIMAPTRELAMQITEEIRKIAKFTPIKVVTIYGGTNINSQIRQLKEAPHIVVGTPGRILDHLDRRTLELSNAHIVVLDEADRMLDMGFIDDVEKILENCPKERQTMLFSATMPGQIIELSRKYQNSPEEIRVSADEITITHISHKFTEVDYKDRHSALYAYLNKTTPRYAIIFCRTKRLADRLCDDLRRRRYIALSMHGNLSQNKREAVIKRFKEGRTQILVATDLAARGLDIDIVTHVINFNLPAEPMTYTHRVGRTGRIGRGGAAFSIVAHDEMGLLGEIERTCKIQMEEERLVEKRQQWKRY
jgi:ATP-dependent RNA helicase DeaD